jgi:hypothetical protein
VITEGECREVVTRFARALERFAAESARS